MANAARGEVELKIDGETFVLCAELERVAAWTHEVGVEDMIALLQRLGTRMAAKGKSAAVIKTPDPHIVAAGVRNLCISDNADKLGQALHIRHLGDAATAIVQALTAGQETGNAPAAREKPKRA